MLTNKDGYDIHIQYVESRLVKFNTRLKEITKNKNYLLKSILLFKSEYAKGGIDIDDLVYSNKHLYNLNTITKYNFGTNTELLRSYIIAFMNNVKIEYMCIELIKQYALLKVPYTFYMYVINELNTEYSTAILNGNIMNLSKGIGNLYIKEKFTDFNNPSCGKGINWAASNEVKAKLIEEGLTPYDKKTAPNGIKWHVKHLDDVTYWWWWEAGSIAGRGCYKFEPTKFVNGLARNSKEFIKKYNTPAKVIQSKLLGNIDKLYRLKHFFPEYMLTFKSIE